MHSKPLVSALFVIAALYDGVLGIAFTLAPGYPFELFGVTPPNHFGYVQFPALLLVVFALMFARIALDPAANRSLIPYGMLLKVSYCSTVFWYWATTGIPGMWKPFALADIVFLALFWMAWASLAKAVPVYRDTSAASRA